MHLKICLEDHTYKIATPETYKALVEFINKLFATKLPQGWHLRYVDSEGDTVILSDDSDFKNLREEQLKSSKILKLIIYSFSLSQSIQEDKIEKIEKESVASSQILVTEIQPSISQITTQEEDKYSMIQGDSSSREHQFKKAKKIVKKLANPGLTEKERERLQEKLCKLQKNFSPSEVRKLELKYLKLKTQQTQQQAARQAEMSQLIIEVLMKQFERLAALPPLKDAQEEPKIVHRGTSCNCCGVYPITGIRYKCSVCPTVDFCEKCEPSADHVHPLLKIRRPVEDKKSG